MDNIVNEINVYEIALHLVTNTSQSDRVRIGVLADEIRKYMESRAEIAMFSPADIYYIVNTILNEILDIAIDWEGSTEYLRAAIVEPIERAYNAAVRALLEEVGLDGLDGLND